MAGLHTNQENGFDFGIAKDHEDQVEFHHECSRGFLNQHFNFYIAFGLNDFFRRHDIRFCIFTLLKKTFSTVEIELIIVFFSQTTFFRRQACCKERRKVSLFLSESAQARFFYVFVSLIGVIYAQIEPDYIFLCNKYYDYKIECNHYQFDDKTCFPWSLFNCSIYYHHANKEQYISNKVTREPIPLRLEAKLYSNFKGLIK